MRRNRMNDAESALMRLIEGDGGLPEKKVGRGVGWGVKKKKRQEEVMQSSDVNEAAKKGGEEVAKVEKREKGKRGAKKGKCIYMFVDAANIWEAQKAKGEVLDLEKLKKLVGKRQGTKNVKVFYYDAFPEEGTRDYDVSGKHKYYLFLEKVLGFVVRKKPLKQIRIETGEEKIVTEKGNMDVEIAIDLVQYVNEYDEVALFSGDSDFMALVNFVHEHEKKIFVYSSRNNVSTELRTGADGYEDILAVREKIWKGKLVSRGE